VDAKPVLGIGYVCDGVMSILPEEERRKVPMLIDYAANGAPFVLGFTWGEQGFFPEIGNRHGNLMTSFLVIGRPSMQSQSKKLSKGPANPDRGARAAGLTLP